MATIKKREGAKGASYLIRVSCGYAVDGTQVTCSMTWKPTPGMSQKAIDKELKRQAVLFEERCAGQGASGAVKFETFARQWFKEYAEIKLRPSTVSRLHKHEERTYCAIGHIRLDKLTSRHIQAFITDLSKPGVSNISGKSVPKADFRALLKTKNMTQKQLGQSANVGLSTISSMCRGESVSTVTAKKVAAILGADIDVLFVSTETMTGLSPKTIRNYLSFISSILGHAVQMGMLQNNPAARVTPPPLLQKEKDCYTLAEAQTFLESLNTAPIKYQAFCVLAIYGGFRRGEMLGLEWSDIDFDNCVITIRRTSLYTESLGVFTDTTKTAKSQRSLKLPASVFVVLKELRGTQAQERLLMGDRW